MAVPITLVQHDFLVGAVQRNVDCVIQCAENAARDGSKLVVFPEMTLTGYPAEDLWLRPSLRAAVEEGKAQLIARLPQTVTAVVGYPVWEGSRCFNAAGVFQNGECILEYKKRCLPNYDVFDEHRYFEAGNGDGLFEVDGHTFGLLICEDLWEPEPLSSTVANGAKCIVTMNASPFHANKWRDREHMVQARARDHKVSIVYLNGVGGQDELVFDGASFVVSAEGNTVVRLPHFQSTMVQWQPTNQAPLVADPMSDEAAIWAALVTGVRDYVEKNGFPSVVLGLSGGIDSAVTLAVAVDALGPERVTAVMMPYAYTSAMSIEDAAAQGRSMGVHYEVIPIETMVSAFMAALHSQFEGTERDTTEENLQARCRGVALMALSNKTGALVLTTGNKSENAVGYATLYGDMAGGFNVLKDVPKTWVYRLANYRNQLGESIIPQRVIDRPPSAELAPDQVDQDSLPDYDVLDGILERYVERDEGVGTIVQAGYDRATVLKVIKMVDRNEYKRRQAPVGVRITPRAFGRDRRYPITSGWVHE